ncbi:MAG: CPBP family intramembrane metalloprotease [Gammaproteobacteria bacterium]|nr:MAG: CPBP family intramembrane metalloprotease [Gammaproteobacteria bacterium]
MNVANSQMNYGPGPASRKPARSEVIASSILLCVLVGVGTDVLVTVMVYLNAWAGPAFPWFIAPALAISFAVFRRSRGWYKQLPTVRPPSKAVSALASVLLGAAIAAAALLSVALVSRDALLHGRIELTGDHYHTTAALRAGVSLTVPVMAALYEEAGARAALQLRLQHVIGPVSAEVLAGIVFVVLHGFVIAKSPWQVPFLALSAFANGRLAAVTQTVGYPVLSHGLSNGILMVTYIIFRGMNR